MFLIGIKATEYNRRLLMRSFIGGQNSCIKTNTVVSVFTGPVLELVGDDSRARGDGHVVSTTTAADIVN